MTLPPLLQAAHRALEEVREHGILGACAINGVNGDEMLAAGRAAGRGPGSKGSVMVEGILTGIHYERAIREATEDLTDAGS